jgi:hypothetical protein
MALSIDPFRWPQTTPDSIVTIPRRTHDLQPRCLIGAD